MKRACIILHHLQPGECRSDASLAQRPCAAPAGKIATAEEAANLLKDDDVVTVWWWCIAQDRLPTVHHQVAGFAGTSCPDLLLQAVRARFDATQHPRNLSLVFVASPGDGKQRGLNRLATRGLVSKAIYAWTGSAPQLAQLVREGAIQAWNLPLGVGTQDAWTCVMAGTHQSTVSHMIRDVAAKRLGPITHIGLHTFVDPRNGGGRLNAATKQDVVHVINLGGQERLWYRAPKAIHIALLRGTTADTAGNVSFEHEPVYLDQLHQAMAAHNSGGKVIVQVQRVVAEGSIPPRHVHIPGALVDKVVVAPPEMHPFSFAHPAYDGSATGELMAPAGHAEALPPGARRVIAHRAMMEIGPDTLLVNLGIGTPEHAQLTVESGTFGGQPLSGDRFGTTRNASGYLPTSTMLDMYQGGALDLTVLGMAQVDVAGNVNVSRFGPRAPGCGGFIDISSTAKRVVFVGTMTTGGLQVSVGGGVLKIQQEGRTRKFVKAVEELTFVSAAMQPNQQVLYVTERAVFGLRDGKLALLEVAPGVDVQRHVLDVMDFVPSMQDVKRMDASLFQ